MSNTIAQNTTAVSFSGASSVNATFGSTMANPSLVVAAVTQEDTSSPSCSVADNKNAGNYAQDVLRTQSSAGAIGSGTASIHSQQNTQTAAATVTATLAHSTTGFLKIFELTGAATSSALDTTGSGGDGSGATAPTVSISTGSANCSVFAAMTEYNNTGITNDTNYTTSFGPTAQTNSYHYGEHRADAGAAGGITLNFGSPAAKFQWNVVAAAYKTIASVPTLSAAGAVSITTTAATPQVTLSF